MRFLLGLCALLILVSSSYSSRVHGESEAGVDVNDVAILLPLDAQKQAFPRIDLNQAQLLNPKHFAQILAAAKAEGLAAPLGAPDFQSAKAWTLVAFRYDPCAPDEAADGVCVQELRLVAQLASANGPQDSALHLIYRLGVGPLSAQDPLLLDLLLAKQEAESALGKATAGQTLGVHPLLAQMASEGRRDLAELYAAIVQKHAKADRLSKLTMMGLMGGSPTHWVFLGGDIQDGDWVQGAIPNLPPAQQKSVALNSASRTEAFFPAPVDQDRSTAGFFVKTILDDASLEKVKNAVVRLENPALSHRNNTDCLSCHSATSVRVNPNISYFEDLESLAPVVPQGITAFPAPGALQNHVFHWNLRAFGYFGNLPSLSMRTVVEAGQVADQLNKILGRPNPGPDCSLVQASVRACFAQSSAPFADVAAGAHCLESCTLSSQ